MRKLFCIALSLLAGGAISARAEASSLWKYLKQYRIGVDYSSSQNLVSVDYETATAPSIPEGCGIDLDDPTRMRCGVDMQARATSGLGVIVQQAFKRQGLFYFNADVGIAARYLQSEMPSQDAGRDGLPLQSMNFRLGAAVFRPYLQFGITPKKNWPDILMALGPAVQIAHGEVSVNGQRRRVTLGSTSGLSSGLVTGFTELEVVLARFGSGLFSVYVNGDYTNGDASTPFYPGAIDGMENFRADFYQHIGEETFGVGLRLLLDWI